MFWSWLFGLIFAAAFGTVMFTLEHMRSKVNQNRSVENRIPLGFFDSRYPISRSGVFGLSGASICFKIAEAFGAEFPSSKLPALLKWCIVTCFLSFVGFAISDFF